MDTSGHLRMSESATRRLSKGQGNAKRKAPAARGQIASPEPERATVGTLSRTKSLLLAALRVAELKQRISD
jgi:hypothetical protein